MTTTEAPPAPHDRSAVAARDSSADSESDLRRELLASALLMILALGTTSLLVAAVLGAVWLFA